jgi:tetratricopeptide (TPR) repeat protein
MRYLLASVAAALALAAPSLAAAQDARTLSGQARARIERKEASEAYRLLEPYEQRFSGDVDFDYWFGVAALESDHLDRAVIAFERVLVRNPGFDSARLELARAYLRMGALDVASQEFDRLAARNPTPEGRKVIEEYRAQIERLRRRQRIATNGYVEAGFGRDTNLSSTTNDFPGAILISFGLPNIVPTGNSIRREDNFVAANAGGDVSYMLAPDRVLFAAANFRWRGYREFDDYDYYFGDFLGGYRAQAKGYLWTASVIAQTFRQDGAFVDALGSERITNDRDAFGAIVEVRRELDAATQIALGAQFTGFRYPTNSGQDTRQWLVSAALDSKLASMENASIGLRAFYSHDEAQNPLNPFTTVTASRSNFGVRVIGQTDPSAQTSWVGALGWSRRIDDDAFARATLVETGRDDLFEAFVRAAYRVSPEWSLQPYFSWIYNRSNIALYAFHKSEVGLMFRYELR